MKSLDLAEKAMLEAVRLMEEFPIRAKFAKTIVALRLALEEIERERLQARVQDSDRAR
jgi:hypothetical protein